MGDETAAPRDDDTAAPRDDAASGKAALRAGVRSARRGLTDGQRAELDEALGAAALAPGGPLAVLEPGAAVAAYASLRTEPGTRALRAALAERGFVVVLPVVLGDDAGAGGVGPALAWEVDPGPGAEGSGDPWDGAGGRPLVGPGGAGLDAAAVVLLPALAVDGSGTRLGQGGGHYDRALAGLAPPRPARAADPAGGVRPLLVAVVREEEVLPAGAIPREAHDAAVDGALTPSGWLWLR